MAISAWVENHKVSVSIIPYEGLNFLVYTRDNWVLLVEDIQSGVREIPNQEAAVEIERDMDRLIKETIDKIIQRHYKK